MSKNRPNRALLRSDAFRMAHEPGKRRPTDEQFIRQVFRDMMNFMSHPELLNGFGIKRVEAICKKCDWPLTVEQLTTLTCPTCGKLKHAGVAFKAEI